MSLKNQIADLNKEIAYFKDSANLQEQKEALETISRRIASPSSKIEEEARKKACFKTLETVDLFCEGGNSTITHAKQCFQTFKTLWNEMQDKSLNDEANTLYELTQSLSKVTDVFSEKHQSVWLEWADIQKDLANVNDVILEQQKSVHRNVDLYDNYTRAKREFDSQMDGFTFDQGQLLRIQHFAKQCAEFKSQMNTEALPEGVKKLFDTLNTVGKVAFVSMLTPEVMDWLEKNNKLDTLMVKQR